MTAEGNSEGRWTPRVLRICIPAEPNIFVTHGPNLAYLIPMRYFDVDTLGSTSVTAAAKTHTVCLWDLILGAGLRV